MKEIKFHYTEGVFINIIREQSIRMTINYRTHSLLYEILFMISSK